MKKKFILTQEETIAELLKKDGFTFKEKQGKTYLFLNDGHMTFSTADHKVVYTNILCV